MTDSVAKKINYQILSLLIIIGAGLLLWFITVGEYDLVLNSLFWGALISWSLHHASEIPRLEWLRPLPRIRKLSGFAISIAFATSAFLSGDWSTNHALPNFFIWKIHIHHLEWSAVLIIFLRFPEMKVILGKNITDDKRDELCKKYSKIEFLVGIFLIALGSATFLNIGIFPHPTSLRLVTGILGSSCIFLSWYLKSKTTKALGFRRVMSCLFGILLGIALQGAWTYYQHWPNSAKHFTP